MWGLALALAGSLISVGSVVAEVTPESLIGGAVSDKGPFYQDLSEAIHHFRQGNVEAARAFLTTAREKAPVLSPVEVMLASLLIDVGQTPAARAELEKAARLYAQDPEAYVRLAELAASEGRVTEASLLFAKATDLADAFDDSPKRKRQVQFRALSGAATIAEGREQWSAARDFLQALSRVEPENAALQVRLAKALFHVGEIKEARRALEAANAADSKSMPADLVMAGFYLQQGDPASAEKCIRALLDSGAENLSAQIGLARWFLQSGDLEQARLHAQRARELDPQSSDAKIIVALVARLRKDLDAAQALLEEVHLQTPASADANNQLALLLLEKPDEVSQHRALAFAELNQRLHPNNAETVATLAWIMHRQGRRPEAERLFGAITGALVSGSAPVTGDSIYYLARFRADQGRKAEARRLLNLLLSRGSPGFYRQEAQSLLAQWGERANITVTGDPPATEAEASDETSDEATSDEAKTTGKQETEEKPASL
jgi:predicted Zn-dependent protease